VAFVTLLGLGTSVGLALVALTSKARPQGVVERFNGSSPADLEAGVADSYAKPLFDMLLTTHNHVIPFSLIFLALGGLFYFTSKPQGSWKTFLMLEPFVATFTTFGGMWLMRYVHPAFVWVVIPSSVMLYSSLYAMIAFIFWDALRRPQARRG
jgi:uncharacterized membrane protein SirB2